MVYELLVNELGLSVFRVEGTGPLSLREFEVIYEENSAWNFLARVW